MSTIYPEDLEADFGEDYEDYEDFPEADFGEARGGRRYRTPSQPQRGMGGGYTRPPAQRTAVTHEQLRQALVRVKQDIDRVANGVRANTANLNDLSGRTTRNLNRVRQAQQRDVARLDASIQQTRELSILGAVLAGSGAGNRALPALLILSMEQPQVAAGDTPAAPAGGSVLGGSNQTSLLLALALAGGLG